MRHFWRGHNTTIINNNFIGGMPMMHRPIYRPAPMPLFGFGHQCCGGGNSKMLNWMMGFGLASTLVGGLFGLAGNQKQNNMYFDGLNNPQGYTPDYNNYNNYNNYSSNQYIADLASKVNSLEDELAVCQKQLEDLTKAQCKCEHNEITAESTPSNEQATTQGVTTPNQKNTPAQAAVTIPADEEGTETINYSPSTEDLNKTEEVTTPAYKVDTAQTTETETLDKILNNAGFNNLDSAAQSYVKSRITQVYLDENGTVKYDIKAVVHDGDNLNSIINRFYTEDEKSDLEVAKAKLHTQGSESRLIVNPLSGDTIIASGVSEYGLKALMQDAQDGITRQGEITKTNKRISDLKTAFINGEKKLSKAYVLQNKLMTEAEYNKILSEKYS